MLQYNLVLELWVLLSSRRPPLLNWALILTSTAVRKGPQRFWLHGHERHRALTLRCQNPPWWRSCEYYNNFLPTLWPPLLLLPQLEQHSCHVSCTLIRTNSIWTRLEYELVDANRVCQGIHIVRVRPPQWKLWSWSPLFALCTYARHIVIVRCAAELAEGKILRRLFHSLEITIEDHLHVQKFIPGGHGKRLPSLQGYIWAAVLGKEKPCWREVGKWVDFSQCFLTWRPSREMCHAKEWSIATSCTAKVNFLFLKLA